MGVGEAWLLCLEGLYGWPRRLEGLDEFEIFLFFSVRHVMVLEGLKAFEKREPSPWVE